MWTAAPSLILLLIPLACFGQLSPQAKAIFQAASVPKVSSGGSFTPPTTGLISRYRVADTWFNSNGSKTNAWADTISHYDVTNGTTAQQPYWTNNGAVINGHPWFKFVGFGMTTNSGVRFSQPNTLFVLAYVDNTSDNLALTAGGNSTYYNTLLSHGGDGPYLYTGGGSCSTISAQALAVNTWYWFTVRYQGNGSGPPFFSLFTNGVAMNYGAGCTTSGDQSMMTVGAWHDGSSFGFKGGIAEVLWYNSNVSDSDTSTVSNYFHQYYGVP